MDNPVAAEEAAITATDSEPKIADVEAVPDTVGSGTSSKESSSHNDEVVDKTIINDAPAVAATELDEAPATDTNTVRS